MGNDLSGNVGSPSAAAATAVVGTTAHDQDHSSSGLYQMTSPMGTFVMYYFVVHQYEKKSMLSLFFRSRGFHFFSAKAQGF